MKKTISELYGVETPSFDAQFKDINVQKAFEQVTQRLLGAERSVNSAYPDKMKYVNANPKDPKIFEGKMNQVLFVNWKGKLCLSNQYTFEANLWNSWGQLQRSKCNVIREYWLGSGFEFELPESFSSFEDFQAYISERLVSDIVGFVQKYKENPDITPTWEREDHLGRPKRYVAKRWRPKFEQSFKGSTYTYPLVMALVNGKDPRTLGIPYTSLSPAELEEIERRLGLTQEEEAKPKIKNQKSKTNLS